MPTISEPAIRLFGGFTQDQLIDLLTSAAPSLWRGTDVAFQIGLGQGGIQSVANVQSLTLEVKELTNKIGAPLVTKTVTVFDDTTTQETWDAGTAQHAVIALTNEDTSIPAGTYWLVLSIVTTDNPARIYTAGGTILAVTEDGAQGGGDAPYFTQSQSDARYALKSWVAKSAAYTMVAGDQILADTSVGALTLTLPGSPNPGDAMAIEDASESFATNNLTVARNGTLIESAGADSVFSTNGVRVYFVFFGGSIGWRVATIGAAAGGLLAANDLSELASPAAQAVSRGNLGIAQPNPPLLPLGSTLDAYGDSIVADDDGSYPHTLASTLGLTLTSHAHGGDQAQDQAALAFQLLVGTTNQQITLALGTNDQRFETPPLGLAMFKAGYQAMAAWLAIPDTGKMVGSNPAITYVGSWANNGIYSFPSGGAAKVTTTPGDTATFEVSGNTIYICHIAAHGDAAVYSISVDGGQAVNYAKDPGVSTTSQNGLTYGPQLIRLTGLGLGVHTVVITLVTAGGGLYLAWVAGSAGVNQATGSNVFVCNIIRGGNYGTYGGSDANVFAFNTAIRQLVYELQSDGLNVALVDASPYLDPATDLADGLHPNSGGQAKLVGAFQVAMNLIKGAGGGGGGGATPLVSATVATPGSVTMATSTSTLIPFDTFAVNVGSQFSASAHQWTVPATAVYVARMRPSFYFNYGSYGQGVYNVIQNTTQSTSIQGLNCPPYPSGSGIGLTEEITFAANAGDVIEFTVGNSTDTTQTGASFNLDIFAL